MFLLLIPFVSFFIEVFAFLSSCFSLYMFLTFPYRFCFYSYLFFTIFLILFNCHSCISVSSFVVMVNDLKRLELHEWCSEEYFSLFVVVV